MSESEVSVQVNESEVSEVKNLLPGCTGSTSRQSS